MYVSVILPVRLAWIPTYSAPSGTIRGQRVEVNFAHRRYVGVVSATGVTPEVDPSKISEILGISELPPITDNELRFWEFISSYYLCTIGEVYKAAYPSLKLKSEQTALRLSQRKEIATARMLAALRDRVSRIEARLTRKRELIRSRKESGRRSSAAVTLRMEEEAASLEKELAAAQEALDAFVSRMGSSVAAEPEPSLQKKTASPQSGKPMLLRGYRRTVLYVNYASAILSSGGQVLLLTPELAFCDRLEECLRPTFGDRLIVFNSQVSKPEQRKIAETVRSGKSCLILGTRSSLFLPFTKLGLIIADEEQDTSYKQTEPAPRYNGRDCAVALAGIHGTPVILGSASPSLETVLNCGTGKYSLSEAAGTGWPCNMDIVDTGAERRKNGMAGLISRRFLRMTADVPGPIVLIRGWEKEDEVRRQAGELLPGRDVRIMTLQEARHSGFGIKAEELLNPDNDGRVPLICILQADALVSRDDFRADERAAQLTELLREFGKNVTIQTAVPERFNNTRSVSELLCERKDFSLPPYTRLVDICFEDSNETRKKILFNEFLKVLPGDAGTIMASEGKIRVALTRNRMLAQNKSGLAAAVMDFEKKRSYAGHIIVDVDPV